ncbi:MAG: ATP-binding protein [Prosthecobacter sp.]
MNLRELSIHYLGPFVGAKITFEKDVTIVTGRNDVGKTSLLRIIRMMCAKTIDDVAGEMDVNFDRLTDPKKPWDEDEDLQCNATFDSLYDGKPVVAVYKIKLAPKRWRSSTFQFGPSRGNFENEASCQKLPKVIYIDQGSADEGIRQNLYLNDPNSTEKRFLNVAFASGFSVQALSKLSPLAYQAAVSKAEERLNRRLQKLLPTTLPFRFKFQNTSDKRELMFLNLIDEHGCSTPLGTRGAGVRRMVDLLGRLAVENLGDEPTLLILDEPETSLHADAQHTLRRYLEELASLPNIQVIYSTHSPCMVNCMRPQSIRLLKRKPHGESAVTIVENSSYAGNYASVRSSLGMSPADSLLYAPVTVVVSGRTEVLCLPVLLDRLENAGFPGFENVGSLLSFSIFIESGGDGNVSNLFRIAEAQGSKAVAFCDGDTGKGWKNQIEKLGAGQSVVLDEGHEFEDLVPKDAYFKALAKYLDQPTFSEAGFNEWLSTAELPPKMSFTNKVKRWLTEGMNQQDLYKADVMRVAALDVDLATLKLDHLQKLVAIMRSLLGE